ncbi:hypothetical protein [Anthocerotibacter panamensis]|uniref:hypothetical protein n=1 Tax=Anthocerotibacter panamensis TaxID=2857077 RepID=UPI001C404E0D|nr:hypothetical protein [Anthocerotibacter panamensis]
MSKALFLLLMFALSPVIVSAESATGKTVDQKAQTLDQSLPYVKSAPKILKVPMSYRLLPLCSADSKEAIKEKLENSPLAGSSALTKPEQLPPQFRSVNGCPQCTREKAYEKNLNILVTDWLRTLPESRHEEIAKVCEKI